MGSRGRLIISLGHVSLEATEGGAIGLIRDGDTIAISIPNRSIQIDVNDAEMDRRRAEQDALCWKPALPRKRRVTTAFKLKPKLTTSPDKRAVRNVELLQD